MEDMVIGNCIENLILWHETGGHEGSGSDETLNCARFQWEVLHNAAVARTAVEQQEIGD